MIENLQQFQTIEANKCSKIERGRFRKRREESELNARNIYSNTKRQWKEIYWNGIERKWLGLRKGLILKQYSYIGAQNRKQYETRSRSSIQDSTILRNRSCRYYPLAVAILFSRWWAGVKGWVVKCDYLSAITGQSHLTRNVRYSYYVSMRLRESIEPGCGEARQRDRLNSQINR